jgi:hypothetical protein
MTPTISYVARPIKRPRATKNEMAERRRVLLEIFKDDGRQSVRQGNYRGVVRGLVTKDLSGYIKVQRAILQMRRDGALPYGLVADHTRWVRRVNTWDSVEEALADTAALYRRNLWSDSPYRVEVWVESESIAGSVGETTELSRVPLMPCRGQASETFAYAAGEAWADDDRIPVVIYIGDHDPAGLEIEESLRGKLEAFYFEMRSKKLQGRMKRGRELGLDLRWLKPADIQWTRLGVTWDQVEEYDLPGTRPKKSYPYPLAVEAEALPAQVLRDLLDDEIRQYIDEDALNTMLVAEESEREVLTRIAATARGAV